MKQNQPQSQRPFVLSMGGFDPSGGAGVLADIKTFEALHAQGLAVITANTLQTDSAFVGMSAIGTPEIRKQLSLLLERFCPQFIKIGLLPNFDLLSDLSDLLAGKTIVWDSVLKASAGFAFHDTDQSTNIKKHLKGIRLITPNWEEAKRLFRLKENDKAQVDSICQEIVQETHCAILLKGGHTQAEKAVDYLYTTTQKYSFESERLAGYEKHGTGCMLASAITAFLSQGHPLPVACKQAKQFVFERMKSNHGLLAFF